MKRRRIIAGILFLTALIAGGCGNNKKVSEVTESTTTLQNEQLTTAVTEVSATQEVTTVASTTEVQTTEEVTPEVSTTETPTTEPPATEVPTTEELTTEQVTTQPVVTEPYDFTICFAGDINLDENWSTTRFLNSCANGIYDCISPELLHMMRSADVMCLNNEFTYSNVGSPLSGKAYTFRANPARVSILQQMGVDVVKLANNHVYDYGQQALLDTFTTLESAGIQYMGAGRNLSEAMKPVYVELDGKTVAFVAASRAEKNKMTPQATDSSPGILRCYDTTLFKQVIAEADKNADFVIAYVHWGTEYSFELEQAQLTTGKEYLDAGADVIIGAHTHCIQGMEYYNGKPIIYSLGNYWFNDKTLDTMLLELHFYGENGEQNLDVRVIPAVQSGCKTQIAKTKEEQERIYSFLESISINVEIDEKGLLSQTY